MRLLITTPLAVVVDAGDIVSVRAEDSSGVFGILPGHTDFLTVLTVSVLSWRDRSDSEHHVAVRGGVLTVRQGQVVEVATREAVGEDTLRALGDKVLERLRAEADAESESHLAATRLEFAAIRQLQRFLEAGRARVAERAPRPGTSPGRSSEPFP